MSGNSFGNLFKLTSFGESHGKAIGGIIDGCPAGLIIDFEFIQSELNRRKPAQSSISTSRNEKDEVEFLSGFDDNKTNGAPIAFMVLNNNSKSKDYNKLKNIFRPAHADYTYFEKYGDINFAGGGRASARETISRVVAGAIAKQFLTLYKVDIKAYTSQIGSVLLNKSYLELNLLATENNPVRCPNQKVAKEMIEEIKKAQSIGDSVGGAATCVIFGVPAGIGEPVFDKLNAVLAHAIFSINAVKGFEIGAGFSVANLRGSENNDAFIKKNNKITTVTNNAGGILGGISSGTDIYFKVAFKPTPSISIEQQTIDKFGKKTVINIDGRHDPCVVPRAIPIIEAMAALVIADFLLLRNAYQK